MSFRVKAQMFGSKLSRMVIPNLGAFMAWGFITAVGVAVDSDLLKSFIVPMLNYLLPLLIAFAGGKMVYDYKGGVIATVSTMGVILGADITMFIGAMIMGPLSAWILKMFDRAIDKKIPVGFELLVNNFSIGIIGSCLALVGNLFVAPAIISTTTVIAGGVQFLVDNNLLPLTAIFIEPAKILFLNNAIGQGILSPLGSIQVSEVGKSILYLLESNPGPGMGVLLAYMVFGKGNSRASAYGSGLIHFFGGIHEIYFPFVLMNPLLLVALIAGGITGTFLFSIFGVGLIGVAAPGSILTISVMAAGGDHLSILLAILASTAVSFVVSMPIVRKYQADDSKLAKATDEMEILKGKKSSISSVFATNKGSEVDYSKVKRIAYACDAGVGSSVMGSNVLQKKIIAAGINDIKVFHVSISDLPTECDLIVTHKSLYDSVKAAQPNVHIIPVVDYLKAPEYTVLVDNIVSSRKNG